VDADLDSYSKTLNHQKILRKTQINNKKIPKLKYKRSGVPFLRLAYQGGGLPLSPRYATASCVFDGNVR